MANLSYFEFEEMKPVKASIDALGPDLAKEREHLVKFIDNYNAEGCDFYWDMIPNIRFMSVNKPTEVAFTRRDCTIWLNAPHPIHTHYTDKNWDFIFCHECMHQLWDTFAVGDQIVKEYGDYNHYILNVASDCVINDFLKVIMKKASLDDEDVNPEWIKNNFDVEYDRYKDTQYTLYLKLIKSPKYKEAMESAKQKQLQRKYEEEEREREKGRNGENGQQQKPNRPAESKEYIDGWNQAIDDFESGKLKFDDVEKALAEYEAGKIDFDELTKRIEEFENNLNISK